MASSMASSFLRRGLRLASPSSLLSRHRQAPFRLASTAPSSSRLHVGARTPAFPAFPRFATHARFASSAVDKGGDAKLKRVLDSEIECAEEDVGGQGEDEPTVPKNFPFTIVDNPGDQTITLKREFGSETIEVSVFLEGGDGEVEEDDKDDNDDDKDNEEESTSLSNISLVVTIDKGKGPSLELCCTMNPHEINIDSLTLKSPDSSDDQSPYEGPEFSDLDESLQEEFYSFLERRGIKPSLASFLHDYLIKKEDREYLTWLKNMKEFIEK